MNAPLRSTLVVVPLVVWIVLAVTEVPGSGIAPVLALEPGQAFGDEPNGVVGAYYAEPYSAVVIVPEEVDAASVHHPMNTEEFSIRSITPEVRLERRK